MPRPARCARWMSGIRRRSQATRSGQARAGAHPRAALVVPADRHDRDPVAAPPSEVDQLDVEDDARDLLAREQVVRGRPREALEPALRVLHRADDPDRREGMEDLAQQAPVARLGRAHVRAVGLDPRTERDVVIGQRRDEQRQLVGRRRHVRVGEDDQVGRRIEHPGPDRRALAAVGDAQEPQGRSRRARPCLSGRASTMSAVASVLPSSTTRTSMLSGSRAAPGAPSRALLAASVQVAEQLVQRRPDPFGLVVRRQDDREARAGPVGRHLGQSSGRCGPDPATVASITRILVNQPTFGLAKSCGVP